jgi:hypothetical protein
LGNNTGGGLPVSSGGVPITLPAGAFGMAGMFGGFGQVYDGGSVAGGFGGPAWGGGSQQPNVGAVGHDGAFPGMGGNGGAAGNDGGDGGTALTLLSW